MRQKSQFCLTLTLHILRAVYVSVAANWTFLATIFCWLHIKQGYNPPIESTARRIAVVRKKQQRSITEKTLPGQTLEAIKVLIAL